MNCLDAETLAAWFDGGLSGAALEDVRSHDATYVSSNFTVKFRSSGQLIFTFVGV